MAPRPVRVSEQVLSTRGSELLQATFHGGKRARSRARSRGSHAARSLKVCGHQRMQVNGVWGERVFIRVPQSRLLSGAWGTGGNTWGPPARGGVRPRTVPTVPQAQYPADQLLPSTSLPCQRRRAGDRAEKLHKARELVGLAQFLGKHQAPRVPGSHFHSPKLLQAAVSALSAASPELPEASWGQQGGDCPVPGSQTLVGRGGGGCKGLC